MFFQDLPTQEPEEPEKATPVVDLFLQEPYNTCVGCYLPQGSPQFLFSGSYNMAKWYYWTEGGHRHGPVGLVELRQLANGKQLLPTDMVWEAALPNWIPASQAGDLGFGTEDNDDTTSSAGTEAEHATSTIKDAGPLKGVIKYRCAHCGVVIESGQSLAGCQDNCPACGKPTPVPLQSGVGICAFFRKLPNSGRIGIAAGILVAVVLVATWLASRDTWERDHGARLRRMCETTVALIREEKLEEGVEKYNQLLAFVGARSLEDPELQQVFEKALEEAEPAVRQIEAKRQREAWKLAHEHELRELAGERASYPSGTDETRDPYYERVRDHFFQERLEREALMRWYIEQKVREEHEYEKWLNGK